MSLAPPAGRGGPQRIPRPPTARRGGPPPWNHLAAKDRKVDLERLLARVAGYRPRFQNRGLAPQRPPSAVLIVLWPSDQGPQVLLTRRSPHLRSHTHEVAFPGGRRDATDPDLWFTATREATEEVALTTDRLEKVGQLDSFVTGGSGSHVHPYVAVLPDAPTGLVANPAEVEQILVVSLDEFLMEEVWREEIWSTEHRADWPVTFFELCGDTVWGATANMLRQLLTIATDP